MNKSNFVHALMAVVLQCVIALITGNWWYGVFLSAGLFWGREHDQKQHNIAEATGRKVKDLEWYEGANMTQWSKDSVLDFVSPVVASTILAVVAPHVLAMI